MFDFLLNFLENEKYSGYIKIHFFEVLKRLRNSPFLDESLFSDQAFELRDIESNEVIKQFKFTIVDKLNSAKGFEKSGTVYELRIEVHIPEYDQMPKQSYYSRIFFYTLQIADKNIYVFVDAFGQEERLINKQSLTDKGARKAVTNKVLVLEEMKKAKDVLNDLIDITVFEEYIIPKFEELIQNIIYKNN